MKITQQQKEKIEQYLKLFNKESDVTDKNNGSLPYTEFDEKREKAIPEMKKVVDGFLSNELSLKDFKEKSGRLALDYNYWGFTGMSGQMQLNQYANNFSDDTEAIRMLQNAITLPKDKKEAKQKINKLGSYLRDIRSNAETTRGLPWDRQALLLSYFWEIQAPEKFPIFYKASRDVLSELGFDLENHDTHGDEYLAFANLIEEINNLIQDLGVKDNHPIWFVEHILWSVKVKSTPEKEEVKKEKIEKREVVFSSSSWLPAIVSDLSDLAKNKETDWSKEKGVKPEKAFETKLRYIFTLLGYDVTELGQGTGREPDGIARSLQPQNGYYAIVYDAKARENGYSLGTDDRSIIEYIQKKKRELERQRISKMYFVIISSEFSDNQTMTEAVRNIYRMTQTPVILLRAEDLMFITEEKLRNVEIDHTLLEDLFLEFGLLTRDKILGVLGA